MPGNEQGFQWSVIDNFSPGIWSQTYGHSGLSTLQKAPRGAAVHENTYGCHALPNGSLVAMPGQSQLYTLASPDTSVSVDGYLITGIQSFGPVIRAGDVQGGTNTNVFDCLYVSLEWRSTSAGPNQRKKCIIRVNSHATPASTATVSAVFTSADNKVDGVYWGTSWAVQRMFDTGGTLLRACLATEWTSRHNLTQGGGAVGESRVHLLPSPDGAAEDMAFTGASITAGPILAHQNRVVQMTMPTAGNPTATFGPSTYTIANDLISFTNPSWWTASLFFAVFNQRLATESPHGYGSWGSMSTGELWLCKRGGGAVIIAGDVSNPIITRLPGVESTGMRTGRAVHTPHGLIYLVDGNGAWIWNGGNTSEKLSPQIDDTFLESTRTNLVPGSTDYHIALWGDLVVFPGNYVFDLTSRSWWQLANPGLFNGQMWCGGLARNAHYVFGAVPSFAQSGTNQVAIYDHGVQGTGYSWQSHILEESVGRRIDIRAVEVEMVPITGSSGYDISLTVSIIDKTGNVPTKTQLVTVPALHRPLKVRLTLSAEAVTSTSIRIQVSSTGGVAAPITNSIAYYWREAQGTSANA